MKIKYLKRERVNRILLSIYEYPLTIVEAPMGFGKTTAVRNFLASEKVCPHWITFQSSGEAIALFWSGFADEICKLDEMAGKALKSLGFPVDAPQTEKVVAVLNSIEYEKKTVFIFDDYHLSNNLQLSRVVLQIASERIENLHIGIITRDTSDINFSEPLAKGICQVISQQQLKFTGDEIRDYCLLMMEHIPEYDIRKISEYTGGWISLIYMILLGLEKGIPVGMNTTIDELIENTLFLVQDRHVREFLMKLSIMDSFTVKQALYITGDKRANEILKKLQKENSFVFYDEVNKTYKIHNVLLDYLRIKQNLKEEELKELLRRLGEWHLEREEFAKAYSYLNRAGEVEFILAHLNNPDNIRNELTEFEGSSEMFHNAPQELLDRYPIAYLQHILLSIVKGNKDTIVRGSNSLERLYRVYEQDEGVETAYKNRVLAEAKIIRKLTRFNHLEASTADNDLIVELLNGEQSYIMLRENEFTFGSPHLLYNYFREQGTFKRVVQIIVDKFPVYSKYSNGCGTGSEYLALAEYGLETGEWQAAEFNSFKAIYKARTKCQYSVIICATFNLIRLYTLQEKVSEGIEMLKQLENEITEVNNPIYNTTIDICKGYIYGNLGQPEKIPYWLQIGDMTTADFLYQGIAFNYLVYGKAVAASRNYTKLEILSETFVEYFSMFSNHLGFIHNGIFEAIAKYNLYGMEAGLEAMKGTLSKGQADDIIMPFVENSPHIIEMLRATANSRTGNEYIERVLFFSERYIESLKSIQLNKVSLTQREKEVLSLAAEGLKREEIAACLFMSQGTVKTHLQNIYQKLDASGKISAIKIAQMHGLI